MQHYKIYIINGHTQVSARTFADAVKFYKLKHPLQQVNSVQVALYH